MSGSPSGSTGATCRHHMPHMSFIQLLINVYPDNEHSQIHLCCDWQLDHCSELVFVNPSLGCLKILHMHKMLLFLCLKS